MITRTTILGARAFRAALFACVAFIPATAVAQGKDATNVYVVRANHEYSDGHKTLSSSRDVVVARARRGDRSMTLQDFQGGAITLESSKETIANALTNPKYFDALSTYDYSEIRASGTGPEVAVFNTYLRPLIIQNPVPQTQGDWSANTTLAALGLAAQGSETAVRIDLHREPLSHNGQDLILIEFAVPAFTYLLADGATVTHWARGVAVTDKDFAVIHVAATQHRATAIGADGSMRPFAVRTSLHGIGVDGRMELRLEELPQVAAAVRRLHETRGDDLLPLSETAAEYFPSQVAARLDLAAFAIGEGGGNPLPTTAGASYPNPADALPPEMQQNVAAFRGEASQYLQARGMPPADAERLLNALLRPDFSRDDYDRKEELEGYLGVFLQMAPSYDETQAPGYKPDTTLTQLAQLYRQADNNIVIEMRLEGARKSMEQQWLARGKSLDDPAYKAALAETLARHRELINKRYEFQVQRLRGGDSPAGSGIGKELVPGWISDPSNPDAVEDMELFLLLREEMRLELEEAEALVKSLAEERAREEKTVYDDTDDFFRNNAFDYSSMVGIVETDLSRWGEWLASQDIRRLERLARLAGYPNLASALADAENIIRLADDDGYRRWALQPPSCSGLAGCGPSYLERWAMKQSIVALGDILADSRDIFSSGGFSDIGISGLNLKYLLRDHSLEDGDIVQVKISQFGRTIYQGQVNLTNLGEGFNLGLGRGVASLEIFAVNEGYSPPNTAQIRVDDVVRGSGTQTYSLRTGETATLRIEAGAIAGAPGGTP